MPDWDVSQVTEHERAVLRQRILQRGYIAMGHLERHEHVPDVSRCRRSTKISVHGTPRASRQHGSPRWIRTLYARTRSTSTYRDGTSARSRHAGICSTTPTQFQHHAGGLGHIQSHESNRYLELQTAWKRGSRAATTTLPERVDAQGQRVRRVLPAPQRRRRQLHRHPRERHVLRPHVRRRVRAGGRDVVHRPGTDRSGSCVPWTSPPGPSSRRRWTRASAIGCARRPCPTGTSSRVTDMSFLFRAVTIQRGHQPVGDVAGDNRGGYV